MTVARLIDHLDSLGIRLWIEQGELRYKAPKDGLSPALRGQIVEQKLEIITFLNQAHAAVDLNIERASRDEHAELPLSFSQKRLWFLAQLEDADSVYNIPGEFRLTGFLNVSALRTSFRQLEERHEALRTSFPQRDGQPFQRIDAAGADFAVVDLANLPLPAQAAEIKRHSRKSAKHVFDLENGPLWHVELVRLSKDSHLLLMPMHHIISDQWSLSVMLRELSAFYAQNTRQVSQTLPELRIQYADFAIWQRRWLEGERAKGLIQHWKDQLAGSPSLLSLPADFARPAVQSGRGAHLYFEIPPAVAQAFRQLSKESGATLFMALEAAFAVLLGRYARQEDVLVGAPISNRPGADTENLIGLFLNTIVLRNRLSGNPTFREMLRRVREVCLAAYRTQSLPFEMLVDALQPQRSLAHTPIFQVMFNLLNSRESGLSLPGIVVERLQADEYAVAKYDLLLTMQEHEHRLYGAFEYSTDLFTAGTIERMAGHFGVLLEAIAGDPDEIISRLPVLTNPERAQILYEWNKSSSDCPVDKCYHELFEAQVARTPDATAIVFTTDETTLSLTYREVNEQANQLAHYLRELGVGRELGIGRGDSSAVGAELIVGVCLERSPETIVSLLAIFKAGGAYVPLDVSLPAERISYMLAKADPAIILTRDQYLPRFAGSRAHVASLDRFPEELGELPKTDLVNDSTSRHLAYVLFTSGSTGFPKGVMIEQRGMVNNLLAKIADHQLTKFDRIAQTAPPSFDISMWQFLAAPLCGGTVHIFGDEIARDPERLIRHTQSEQITILEVVPSLFRFMLDELAADDNSRPSFAALRWLSLTGEALPSSLCNRWLHHYPHIPILNAYGPAECSDDATHYVVNAPLSGATVPIGGPLPHVRLYVLDTERQPVPVGVPGELYIGGIGVGRGYINDAERTAQCFLGDFFVPKPDARLYKTGDLVRHRPDATLEFLGRLDHQVKLRGLRIELGEIEAVLEAHPDVEQAAAAVNSDGNREQELVAYVTLKHRARQHEVAPLAADWRTFLTERLPAYMVPRHFVVLDSLPLNSNGKLDRDALPALDIEKRRSEKTCVPPRTETEKILADIWQEVLRAPQIGIEENFFEVGGHSLLATQVASRIRRHWQIELPLRKLFEAPTIAELAGQIERMQVTKMLQETAAPLELRREEVSL